MNYEEAIKKPFTDLKKLLIGIVFSIMPIVNLVALGYAVDTSGLGKSKGKGLPKWDDLSHFFFIGLKAAIVHLIYLLPVILIGILGFGVVAGDVATVIMNNVDEFALVDIETATDAEIQALVESIVEENWAQILPALIAAGSFWIVAFVFLVLASYMTPVAILHQLKKKGLGEAFDVGTVAKKAFTKEYFLAWALVLVIKTVSKLVFGWIPVIGLAMYFFVSRMIAYSIYGQVYKKVK